MTATVGSPTDPATAVVLARRLLQSGAWRTVPKTGDATDKAWYLLHAKAPAALAVLPRVAVAALTKPPPSPGCHWCVAYLLAVLSFGDDQEGAYPARDEHTLAFLGQPCSRCAARHEARLIADRERAHQDQLVAAGLQPAAAARIRSPEQLRAQAAALRRLKQARPPAASPPAPTGFLWAVGDQPSSATAVRWPAGGQPAAVTAALGRRAPRWRS